MPCVFSYVSCSSEREKKKKLCDARFSLLFFPILDPSIFSIIDIYGVRKLDRNCISINVINHAKDPNIVDKTRKFEVARSQKAVCNLLCHLCTATVSKLGGWNFIKNNNEIAILELPLLCNCQLFVLEFCYVSIPLLMFAAFVLLYPTLVFPIQYQRLMSVECRLL